MSNTNINANGNVIQIKRGIGRPDGVLHPYEMGIDIQDDKNHLYIGGPERPQEDGSTKLGAAEEIEVGRAVYANEAGIAAIAESATSAGEATVAKSLNLNSASYGETLPENGMQEGDVFFLLVKKVENS